MKGQTESARSNQSGESKCRLFTTGAHLSSPGEAGDHRGSSDPNYQRAGKPHVGVSGSRSPDSAVQTPGGPRVGPISPRHRPLRPARLGKDPSEKAITAHPTRWTPIGQLEQEQGRGHAVKGGEGWRCAAESKGRGSG